MLVLVISSPHPTRPDEVTGHRLQWQQWAAALERTGEIKNWYLRVGRGAVVVFDLADNDALHARLTQWLTFIPAELAVYPLVDRDAHERVLQKLENVP